LTEEYLANHEDVLLEVADMRTWKRLRHLKEWIRGKLANAEIDPIIGVENVTPEIFMEYLDSL
jgi:hypothetical protein